MADQVVKVLLVEDNPGDARLIQEMLAEAGGQAFVLEWVTSLASARERLEQGEIDLVLLDLGLPDSQGLKTFVEAYAPAPDVPFVVLSGLDDETLALTAVRQGAQDYLVKGATDAKGLLRAIRYATERKSAEKAIEAERQKLFSVLNALPAFVHLTGADFAIRFANRRFKEVFGEPGDRPCYEVLLRRSEPCGNCRALEVLKTRVPQKFAWTSALDGRTYEVYHYPFCANEGPLVLTLGVDITERKQGEEALRESEERFRTIFEDAAIGICLADLEGRIITCNPALQRMMGCATDALIGKTFMEITHPDDLERNLELFRDLVARRLEQYQLEKRYRRSDGQYFWARVTVSSIKGAGSAPRYNIAMIEDITQRKQMQDKLRESEQNLRYLASQLLTAQERERERIARELHDELGQSLLVMKFQAKHIERGLDLNQVDIRKECRGMLQQLDQLVEEVRRLARDLSPTMVKDLGLSSALRRLVKEFSRHYGIKAAIDMAEGLDEFFPRETQIGIYRIFQESLTNIGKYAQASKLRIDIKREDSQVSILVADNGRGFNVDEVLGPDPTRRGLGLMAMEERARMIGGTLKIRSQEGEGTRIALNIPISDRKAGQGGN
jgi:PAS domain S-box-containing protein